MKKIVGLVSFVSLCFFPLVSFASQQSSKEYTPYIQGKFFVVDLSGDGDNEYWNTSEEISYDVEYEKGEGFAISGGIKLKSNIRFDVELSHYQADISEISFTSSISGPGFVPKTSGSTTITSIMGNAYYNLDTKTFLSPYIGAGMGISHVDFDGDTNSGIASISGDAFAYQVMVGLDARITDHIEANLEYRHFRTSDLSVEDDGYYYNVSLNLQANNFGVGLRYNF